MTPPRVTNIPLSSSMTTLKDSPNPELSFIEIANSAEFTSQLVRAAAKNSKIYHRDSESTWWNQSPLLRNPLGWLLSLTGCSDQTCPGEGCLEEPAGKENQPPKITYVPDQPEGRINELLKFRIQYRYPEDGETLELRMESTASDYPNGARLIQKSETVHNFDWTPREGEEGWYGVRFVLSDGELEDQAVVTFQVLGIEGGDTDGGTEDGEDGDDPINKSVRVHLSTPGISHGFVRLWSFGESSKTYGMATDLEGKIFVATKNHITAIERGGNILWQTDCSNWDGCAGLSANGDQVYMATPRGELISLDKERGELLCHSNTGDLPLKESRVGELLATQGFVTLRHTWDPYVTVVYDANNCEEKYRLTSPNGEKPSALVVDENLGRLSITWDDAGGGNPQSLVHEISTGQEVCNLTGPSEAFRMLLAGGYVFGGWSRLLGHSIQDCSPFGSDFTTDLQGGYGDVRDISIDASRGIIFLLTNGYSFGEFHLLDANTLQSTGHFADFHVNQPSPIGSLNKMAIGGDWIFVPDGVSLASGRFRIFQFTDAGMLNYFGEFAHGETSRLGDRFIDGGLLLTQVQKGVSNTPLVAYDVGVGEWVGYNHDKGSPKGNKYCDPCLEELNFVEVDCDTFQKGYRCTIGHNYYYPIEGAIVLANLPTGTWDILEEGINGFLQYDLVDQVSIPGPFQNNRSRAFLIQPSSERN